MIKNKVAWMFALGLILLIGSMAYASATEWDNKLKYSEDDMMITFQDTFLGIGFIPINNIGTAELKSHRTVDEVRKVSTGNDRVLTWYEFTDFKDVQVNALKGVEFIDMREEIADRDYLDQFIGRSELLDDSKIMIPNPDYNKLIDKTYQFVYLDNRKWLPYNSKDIPTENIIIGVQADLFWGEYLDVVWNIYGKKLDKHAVVEGVSAGFVVTAPVGDPNGDDFTRADGRAAGGKFVSPATAALVTEIGWYAEDATEEANFEVGIYDHNVSDDEPEAVVGSLSQTNAKGTGAGWIVVSGLSIPISGSTTYWIAFQLDSTASQTNLDIQLTTGRRSFKTASTLPSPWGGPNTNTDNRLYAIYAVWEEAPAPAPFITLDAPENGTTIFIPTIDFQCTAFDDVAVVNVSLQWDGTPEQTNTSGFNNTAYNFTKTMTVGLHEWACEAWDDEDSVNNTVPVFHITYQNDLVIALNAPVNEFNSTSQTLDFNGTPADDTTVINVSFILNGVYNGTNSSVFNNTIVNFVRTLSEGKHNWTMEACDAVSCVNATARNFTIDTTPPDVLVIFPNGEVDSFSIGDNLFLNWSINDTNLDSCWSSYDGTNTSLTCTDNQTTFTPVLGQQNLIIYANDTLGNLGSDFTSWTYGFLENNVSVNFFVNETASEDFRINLTTDINILSISATLNYNGTLDISDVTCTAGTCTLENTLDIPLVSTGEYENKSFFWQIAIFNGTDALEISTSSREQNVTRVHLEDCSATFTDDSLNFTAYDEQTLIQLDPYNFNGTFEYWVGSGSVRRTNSSMNNSIEYKACIKPIIEMKTDAIIDYVQNGTTNYTSRFYYLDDFSINTTLQDIKMYLLLASESTSFILKVQDDSLLPVTDALIEVHRYYPGEGIFRIVQIAKTDDTGKSVGFFETETVDYKLIIKKVGKPLLETNQQKVIPESSPFTLTFNIGEPLGEPWQSQVTLDDLNSSLTWNDMSGIVTYIYIDSSGNFTLAKLTVVKTSLVNSTNDTTICNTNLTIPSGTLTCNVGSTDGFYLASSFITRNNTVTLDLQFSFQVETLSGVVGLLGLFFGWFIILVASFMFKFNEIAGIWAITITVFLVNIIGLIKFGGVFVTAVLGVAIILTWLMEK